MSQILPMSQIQPSVSWFLRGNQYEARDVANQMIQYFGSKAEPLLSCKTGARNYHGRISVRMIQQASLNAGWLQLAGKDKVGRLIYLPQVPSFRNFKNLENELRGKFYFWSSLLKSNKRNSVEKCRCRHILSRKVQR